MNSSGNFSSSLPNEFEEFPHQKILEAHSAVEFFLEDLELLLSHSYNYDLLSLHENLKVMKSFLARTLETPNHHPIFSSLVNEIAEAAGEFLRIPDPLENFVLQHSPDFAEVLSHSSKVSVLVGEIKSIEKETMAFSDDQSFNLITRSLRENPPRENSRLFLEGKIEVGFDDEARVIKERLICGWKRLDVITISGMAGIGKTTLAKRLYNDSSIVCHFHKRAWISVSKTYQKGKLLEHLLSSILTDRKPNFDFHMVEDEYIGSELYKSLMGIRYLIVLDDIWDVGILKKIKIYFPDDGNSSRILITSHIKDVPSTVGHHGPVYVLRFLAENESWDLFQSKIFGNKTCPEELMEIGKEIVTKCKGLPLAIVVVAGLLAKLEKSEEWWRHVAANIGSSITTDSNQFMDTLALSYTHLPCSLKSCFLYLGSFPEDYEIPTRRLIKSWISEGFIQPTTKKSLEDVAEDYLSDLIDRSLVIVGKRSSGGGIKSCFIHDMLRDMCLTKAKDKKFMQPICKCAPNASQHPDLVRSFADCQYFHFYRSKDDISVCSVFTMQAISVYKLIRTLDLSHIMLYVNKFPDKVLLLVHLKSLALYVFKIYDLPPSISKLRNLETFELEIHKGRLLFLPRDIWKMVKLRHLKVSKGLVFEDPGEYFSRDHPNKPLIYSPRRELGYAEGLLTILNDSFQSTYQLSPSASGELEVTPTYLLDNLQTISKLYPSVLSQKVLARTPNIRRLAFHVSALECEESLSFPNLANLRLLEALKFECGGDDELLVNFPLPNGFPPFLKKLTLSGPCFKWEEISFLGFLSNLAVLKIERNISKGEWKTSDHGFCQLRFLKLSQIGLSEWISLGSHFPRLERLVLYECIKLKEIPLDIGDVSTLQTIEVYNSSYSTVDSVKKIQESQRCTGKEDLKIIISSDCT